MVQCYLAEKSLGHPDSPHIGWRSLLAIENSKIFYHLGRLNEVFKLDENKKPVCTSDDTFRVYGPLTDKELNIMAEEPFDNWGELTRGKRIHSLRKL